MPFGRSSARQNNRSQHSLVGSAGVAAVSSTSAPSAADPGPAVASTGPSAAAAVTPAAPGAAARSRTVPANNHSNNNLSGNNISTSTISNSNSPAAASPNPALVSAESFDSFGARPPPPTSPQQLHQQPQLHQQQHQQQAQQLQLRQLQQQQLQQQQQQQQQQQHPAPPPQAVSPYPSPPGDGTSPAIPQLHHSNTVTASLNSRQKDSPEFIDLVSRSQSQRYSQASPLPVQHQPFAAPSAGSFDSLPDALTNPHPHLVAAQGHPIPIQQQQQQQQQQPTPKKQSTRKLIKNFLAGNNRPSDPPPAPQPHHSHQHSYAGPSGVTRRSSKRASQLPTIRTGSSQVSLDQPTIDWQSQGPHTQPSPLQDVVGEAQAPYLPDESNHPLASQKNQDIHNPHTIRPVPADADTPTYSSAELAYLQQQSQQYHPQIVLGNQPPQQQQEQQQQYQYNTSPAQQAQYQAGARAAAAPTHLVPERQPNPETVSQLSHESPVAADLDQSSIAGVHSPPSAAASTVPAGYQPQGQDLILENPPSSTQTQSPLSQQPPPQQQQQAMHPAGQPPARRSQEAEKPPPGPPPSYRHSQQPNMNTLPPLPPGMSQQGSFRQSTVQERQQFEGQAVDQGRNSPQPTASGTERGEDPEKAFKDLLSKYKNVKRLYFDGKKDIEQLTLQVEQLQNAVAKQRMSQSRTSLDDSEYSTRFSRLNGAITNLAFNIRKDWVSLPPWLAPYVSPDAVKTGKQEMTAVGRAIISRWVVDEIFDRCFHPGLDPDLSDQLKQIERNIRHFSYTLSSQEEYDALTAKVVGWRMATLEGLADALRSPESAEHQAEFTREATANMTNSLLRHLADPPPPGVDGSASMIVELAVAIATNLPMESRDVAITYPLPELPIRPEIMEVEKAGLPPLEARPADASDEAAAGDEGGASSGGSNSKESNPKDGRDRRNDKPRPAPPPPKDPGKIRFAGFVAVEVRGRQVLIKAPVWSLA